MNVPAIKIAIVGPECTGKSSLSQFLADHYHTAWVPEYARGYLDNLHRPYDQSDLLHIAEGQLRLEDEFSNDANKLLVCDTNLIVIKIWSEFNYGTCDPLIVKLMQARKYDLYLLTYIDIPWEEDPLREHPTKREELYQAYYRELTGQGVPFVVIQGEREQRRKTAIEAINKLL
jgi:NadR type nicotinamide-nucleotide adenylyltransferase